MRDYAQRLFHKLANPLKVALKWIIEWSSSNSNRSIVWNLTIVTTPKNPKLSDLKYKIMPLISRRSGGSILLSTQHDTTAFFLTVDLHHIQWIFIPLHDICAPTRGKILDMIGFLNLIQSSSRDELIDKMATTLIQAFNSEILLPSVNVLNNLAKIATNGYTISSLEMATHYATKLLNCDNLPGMIDVRALLMVALNFVTISQHTTAFASKLEALYFAAFRLLVHGHCLSISSTEVVIFTTKTCASLISISKRRCLDEAECTLLLKVCQINLTTLPMTATAAGRLVTYSALQRCGQ